MILSLINWLTKILGVQALKKETCFAIYSLIIPILRIKKVAFIF